MHATEEVIYNGRRILKNHFRAYVYGQNEAKKLVNSWDEFEAHMATGLWFPSKAEVAPKPKPRRKPAQPVVVNGLIEEDFLPNDAGE